MRHRAALAVPAVLLVTAVPAAAGPTVATAAVAGPGLTVDMLAPRHPISPDIYGMNHASEQLAAELRLPVRRWGGNATTRYHYAHDTTNRGADWYFENVPGPADPAALPDGSETDAFVEQDRRTGADTILTVPLIGWVPKARDYSCGFSVEKYGPQEDTDAQWRPDCGNGIKPDGTHVTGNDPHDTSVEAGAEYVTEWLGHLTGKYGTADDGGVRFYSFDNEPDIWHATHRDVHPAGATYDEIRDRTYEVGAAVKAADPGAATLGPVGWGWNSLFMSGHDQETCNRLGGSCWSDPPDRAAHGGVPFAEWYLAQLRAYERQHGVRLLDYFDNHWYPQGAGVAFGNGDDPETNALRLRSTRNLWDPEYVDESWINEPTRLIPRMKELVADHYPGTKTAVTEYNWGALDHINGALAQADVLGIFGREGLDLATLWAPPAADDPGAYAFRMFRDYDGQGGEFGTMSVRAVSADQDKLSVYAAQTPGRPLTVVVVNKTGEELNSTLRLAGGDLTGWPVDAWQYSAADLDTITRTELMPVPIPPCVDCGAIDPTLSGVFPANSITTIEIDAVADTDPPTIPGPPVAADTTPTTLTVDWPMGTDNVGVSGYEVNLWNGKVEVGTASVVSSSYRFTGLLPGEPYHFFVRAQDPAGNWSEWLSGGPVTLPWDESPPPTTPPPTTPPPTTPPPTTPPPTTPPPTPGCAVAYQVVSQWDGGFQAEVTVRNPGTVALDGWTVTWAYGAGQQVRQVWNATWTPGATGPVTVRNAAWNRTVPPGGSRTFGLLGAWQDGNPPPAPTCTSP